MVMDRRIADVAIRRHGVTWTEIVAAEPRLLTLESVAVASQKSGSPLCHLEVWYGWRRGVQAGLKSQMTKLVGWMRGRRGDGGLISTTEAYDRAYGALWTRLLPCRACGLGISEQESVVQQLLVDRLEALGIEAEMEVSVPGGRADVVTEDAVYEVKPMLGRHAIYQAIGQVVIYAAALNKPRRVIVGLRSSERVDDLIAHARLAGVEVETW